MQISGGTSSAIAVILVFISTFLFVVYQPSMIRRIPYPAPEPAYHSWEDILSHPQPITIRTYSTGMMTTLLSGIMNLEHSQAQDIKDELVQYPVNVNLIQHQELGSYLIDAGLDASYVHNPLGSMKGIMVKGRLGRATQDPNTDIATILDREKVRIEGVFLTHMHFDTAGILDLPKDIPYFVSEDEPYQNFRFFFHGDHFAGVKEIYDIDLAAGIELPPFGKSVDVFGDGSLWAIPSSGHSKGHMMYFVNGIEGQILVTADACNTQYQFDTGIGPGGTYSSNVEQAQVVLDRIRVFKERYPQVRLVYGHDLPER
jgi:glyoxylase-like metal-dependent hydrolase (beta-lactamase superfamily II)